MSRSHPKGSAIAIGAAALSLVTGHGIAAAPPRSPDLEPLPAPRTSGTLSLEAALARRRSIRALSAEPLRREEIGQLLWAAQGITDAKTGGRSAPSAGAIHPLALYVVRAEGVARYAPDQHALVRRARDDARRAVAKAALDQEVVRRAPAVFVIAADVGRVRARYGDRAERFVALEAGHAAENLLLEAAALGLAATPVGAFDDQALRAAIELPRDEEPLYVLPVGRPEATQPSNGSP